MLEANGRINLCFGWCVPSPKSSAKSGPTTMKRIFSHGRNPQPRVPCFGLIFIGFACGKAKKLPEQGLAWMNFFLLYVSLPALLFGIMSKTPFEELNNPPLADCDYPRNEHCFRPCPVRRQAGGAALVPRSNLGRPLRKLR